MDEHSFDNLIKGKLENYSDPQFDEEGFEDVKARLREATKTRSISTRVLLATAVSSLIVLTLFNIYFFFYLNEDNKHGFRDSRVIAGLQAKVDSLSCVVSDLVTEQRINMKAVEPVVNSRQVTSRFETNHQNEKPSGYGNRELQDLGQEHAPSNVLEQSTFTDATNPTAVPADTDDQTDEQLKELRSQLSVRVTSPGRREISLAMRNKIEEHYFHGIGIDAGMHFTPMVSSIRSVTGLPSIKTGLSVDWIFSPRWSVETGIDYAAIRIRTDNGVQVPEGYKGSAYGSLETTTISTKLISSPVAIKYRQWISENVQGYLKVGYVPYFSFGRRYELKYKDGSTVTDPDEYQGITRLVKSDVRGFYGNNVSFSAGFTRSFKKQKVDLNLFYEKAVGGNQSRNNLELFGLNVGYWIKVR
jgi:hypothetical protein